MKILLSLVSAAVLWFSASASWAAPVDTPAPAQSMVRLAQSGGSGGYLPPSYGRETPPRGDAYSPPPRGDAYSPPPRGDAYSSPPQRDYRQGPSHGAPAYRDPALREDDRSYSSSEILDAGHRFFGAVSKSLAQVIEYTFSKQGRPNGYILGEEAGGAFVAGLRYGEGRLYTKFAGDHKVFWQGPSIGYDVGGEGSKTLILVYNLVDSEQIYQRYAGIDGSAYLVGGVGVTFQKQGDVILAPIRSGVGVRLGANVGYLKYTRYPTWNPF
jgi:hypothetical protein